MNDISVAVTLQVCVNSILLMVEV